MSESDSKKEQPIIVRTSIYGEAKTCLIRRFVKNEYRDHDSSMEGLLFKNVFIDSLQIKMVLLEESKLRWFQNIPNSCRNAQIALVCFDVISRDSYDTCNKCIEIIREQPDFKGVLIAVANRKDLVENRQVDSEEARQYYASLEPPIPCFETSAKTGEGVNELFYGSVKRLIQKQQEKIMKKK